MMDRILAVDLGGRRIGLAVSDPLGLTAQGLPSIMRSEKGGGDPVPAIAGICREHGVAKVVVGLPLNMNGTRGPEAEKAERLAAALAEATGLPVVMWDERLTSVTAERALIEGGVSRAARRRKGLVDQGAATVILQTYLSSLRRSAPGE